ALVNVGALFIAVCAVGGPLLGGDDRIVPTVCCAARREFVCRAIRRGPSGSGVRPPQCAGLVDVGQVLGAGFEWVGGLGRLCRLLLELCAPCVIVGRLGFGSAQRGGSTTPLRGLAGAGELVGDIGRCPGLLAFVGANSHVQLAVAHLGLVAV